MNRTTDELAEAFLQRTLPRAEWTHEAHLRVGLWHLLRYSPEESLEKLREGISCYNVSIGGLNTNTAGYHETITRFYVWLIAEFLAKADRSRCIDDFTKDLIATCGNKNLPLQYWSKDRLFSVEARLGWLEPDLQQLEETLTSRNV